MGVDFGEIRIGLALSDETGSLATPLATLHRRPGRRPPVRKMAELVRTHGVQALVVGLPLELSGAESDWTREVRGAAQKLGERLGLPVHLVDERMSSVRAERAIRSSGRRRRERESRSRVDAGAATVILQDWLDRQGARR
jgi:putative Holliday junction resolvase